MSLLPNAEKVTTETNYPGVTTTSLAAYSAYDLPSVEALVRYFHATTGYPVKDTWLKAIRAGTYAMWPGLTLQNATRYFPVPVATLKGHMVQTRQNFCSTKPKPPSTSPTVVEDTENDQVPIDEKPSNELHISVQPMSKLYTDDTGQFPVCTRSGNQYIMIATSGAYQESSRIICIQLTHGLYADVKFIARLLIDGCLVICYVYHYGC